MFNKVIASDIEEAYLEQTGNFGLRIETMA
jgi:hypothetical protein